MAFAFSGTTLAALTITVSGTETSLTNLAALLNGVTTAARSTAYTTGTIKNAGNGNGYWYLCTTAGTTSATAPTWPTTEAGTVVDGGVTWTAFAQGYVLNSGLKQYCNISRFLFRFAASASLSYDAELWCLVGNTNVPSTSAQVIVPSGSILTIGALTAASQDAAWYRNVQTDGLILPKDNGSTATLQILQVDSGGTLNLYGAAISSRSVISLSGTFRSRNGVIHRPTGGNAWRVNFGANSTIDIIGLYAPSVRWCAQLGMTVTNLSGFRGFDNLQWDVGVLSSTASSFFTIRDQPYNGFPSGATGVNDVANRNGFCWRFLNAEKGDALNVTAYTSTTEGVTEVAQEVTVKLRTAAGGSVDTPIWFARGYNNGKRRDYTSSPRPAGTQYATQGDDTYVVIGNSAGDCPATALINFVCVSNLGDANNTTSNTAPAYYDIRCDGGTRGSNLRTIYYKRYGSLPQTLKAAMLGVGGTTISVIDAADTSVTLSRTSAGALSSISTLDDFYDSAIYWSTTPVLANLEYPTRSAYLVSANGTQISLGSLNLVIDATASAAFAVDTGTNTITIKASTLALGSKFTSITTTGTVTFANGASVGTNVVVASSSGTNGWITVSGMGAGSRLLVLDQSSSQSYNGVPGASQSIYIPPGVTGSYSGTVALYGKQDVTWAQVVTGGGLFTISVVQIPDTGITQPTGATVAAYAQLATPEQVYDYAAYWKTTATGIAYPRLVSKVASSADLGSYNVVQDATAGTVWSWNNSTSTLTYKSPTLAPGSILTSIATSGSYAYANGAVATCVVTSSAGTTGVFTITGLLAGSSFAYYNGSAVRQSYISSTGTTLTLYLPAGISGSWSFTLAAYGYVVITGTVPTTGGYQTVAVNQLADTGITQGVSSTVAAYTALNTPDQVYDYAAYFKTTSTGIDYPTLAIKAGTVLDLGTHYLVVDPTAALWTWNNGTNTLKIKSANYVAGTTYTRTQTTNTITGANGGVIGIEYNDSTGLWRFIAVNGQISGTRLQIYNATDSVSMDNLIAGTSYAKLYRYTSDKSLQVKAVLVNGLTAYNDVPLSGTFGINGAAFTVAQTIDVAYSVVGLDGSTPTEFAPDYLNNVIDINAPSNTTTAARMYAWFRYNEMSANGVANFFNLYTSTDGANFLLHPPLKVKNTGSAALAFSGNMQRSDGAFPFDTSGGFITQSYGPVVIAGLEAVATDVTDIRTKVDANLDAKVSLTATQTSVNAIPVNPLLTTDARLNYLNAPVGSIPTNPLLTTDTRLNNLNAPVGSIPTNPLLTTDTRLNNLNAPISAIPTTPLLTSDARLNNLNAPISAIPTNPVLVTDSRLTFLDATITSRLPTSAYTTPPNAQQIRDAMALGTGATPAAGSIDTQLSNIQNTVGAAL